MSTYTTIPCQQHLTNILIDFPHIHTISQPQIPFIHTHTHTYAEGVHKIFKIDQGHRNSMCLHMCVQLMDQRMFAYLSKTGQHGGRNVHRNSHSICTTTLSNNGERLTLLVITIYNNNQGDHDLHNGERGRFSTMASLCLR